MIKRLAVLLPARVTTILLDVLKGLRTAIAAKPNDLNLQMQEVRLLLVTNQLDKAKSAFEAIRCKEKQNADVDLLHAEVLLSVER